MQIFDTCECISLCIRLEGFLYFVTLIFSLLIEKMSIQVRDSKAYGDGYYLVIETLPEMEEPYLYISEMF